MRPKLIVTALRLAREQIAQELWRMRPVLQWNEDLLEDPQVARLLDACDLIEQAEALLHRNGAEIEPAPEGATRASDTD